jgi:hypothetical protein
MNWRLSLVVSALELLLTGEAAESIKLLLTKNKERMGIIKEGMIMGFLIFKLKD